MSNPEHIHAGCEWARFLRRLYLGADADRTRRRALIVEEHRESRFAREGRY